MVNGPEYSAGGSRVYRHQAKADKGELVGDATPHLARIEAHIAKWIGPSPMVFHELISTDVHLDLHVVPPTHRPASEEYPLGGNHYTIVTSGLSSRPMAVPQGAEELALAELMIALPADWPGMNPDGTFDDAAMQNEANWWPLRWLKMIARMPHEYDTWITMGHTIPNGDPAEPYAPNTRQCCMLVGPAALLPDAGQTLDAGAGRTINFYGLIPLYQEEMDLKLNKGMPALAEKLAAAGVTELVAPARKNTCRKRFLGLF